MIPFVLGVTGHRQLPFDDGTRIEELIRQRLRWLKERMPTTRIVLVSAQAEGADRLVSRLALEAGFELWSVLPTDAGEYARDFATKSSLEEFQSLLAQSSRVLNASALCGRSPTTADRPQIYVDVGAEICRLSHALLAVWDGVESGLPGGTGQVVREFLTGESGARQTPGLPFPDCGVVFPVPVINGASVPTVFAHEFLYPRLSDSNQTLLHDGDSAFHARFIEGMRSMEAFNTRGASESDGLRSDYLLPPQASSRKDDQHPPFSPPSGPATGSFNGLHRESNFLAIAISAKAT